MGWGFYTCGPNEALVVSGCCYNKPYYVPGGRVFVLPFIQRLDRISLNIMTLIIESPRIYTRNGVPITVTGVAQVKIQSSSLDMLSAACEQFLGKSEREIQEIARETLEGHQRAIMGNMTVEEIYKDRKLFSRSVFEVASSDLVNMGISVVSYTLKDIKDDEGYLEALGMARTAQVKRDARIGEAEARRDAGIRAAQAEEARTAEQLRNKASIARSQRDLALRRAACDREIRALQAKAQLAYQLQVARTQQAIRAEVMGVELVERKRRIELEELERQRAHFRLEAEVRSPAASECFRLRALSEAEQARIKAEAEAEADAVKLKGLAEAEANRAVALAEAEKMQKVAEALKNYQGAAMLDMVLQTLPRVAAEVSSPLANCNKVTMVSTGDGEVGIAKLSNEIIRLIESLPQLITSLTGQDMKSCIPRC
ncbi:flotillin 1 [Echinococcus multilocularis]|uniref:Flotillin 1 n=1 Tax=Echinococcus multilocularis TaxID=6211 RepID=A0A068Y3F6_ECHMU|nr:flotillin 1 [Echinococcus multilocularis]